MSCQTATTAPTKDVPSEGLVVDTNVHLFQWPFRGPKYDDTEALVENLRRLAAPIMREKGYEVEI